MVRAHGCHLNKAERLIRIAGKCLATALDFIESQGAIKPQSLAYPLTLRSRTTSAAALYCSQWSNILQNKPYGLVVTVIQLTRFETLYLDSSTPLRERVHRA